MEFNKLNEETICICTENANEDVINNFVLKINKNELRLQDFNTYWEKGRRPTTKECSEICSLKGLSISIFNNETKEKVLNIFKTLFPLAPGYKPYLAIVSFKNGLGVTKYTPSKINQFHFDFYKCDAFDYKNVNLINITELH